MGAANAYSKADNAYLAAEIETMSRRDILVKLYQHAEKMLVTAQIAMQNRQIEQAYNCCRKARDIFVELHSTLNFEQGGDVAKQLASLYTFIVTQITEANLRQDSSLLKGVMPTIATLREAWEQIPDEHANVSSLPEGNHGHSLNVQT
ncbi:MAG: flagellar export chaperone FliS [Planctomycetes bacterium]|jgi:flagellar protein FliS|nr:flagellar export chaperone FliS [Planctomycetota bacterium]